MKDYISLNIKKNDKYVVVNLCLLEPANSEIWDKLIASDITILKYKGDYVIDSDNENDIEINSLDIYDKDEFIFNIENYQHKKSASI